VKQSPVVPGWLRHTSKSIVLRQDFEAKQGRPDEDRFHGLGSRNHADIGDGEAPCRYSDALFGDGTDLPFALAGARPEDE
jgi:hypothetical protein